MLGPFRENFHAVYINDLVNGFVKTMETEGIAGETFILGGPRYVPLREFVAEAARAVGAPPPMIRLPYNLFYAGAAVCEAVRVPLKVEPPLHRRRVRFLTNNPAFSLQQATHLLDRPENRRVGKEG